MTPPRGEGITPTHCFRCPDELWERAKAAAAERGETLAGALVGFLREYVGEETG